MENTIILTGGGTAGHVSVNINLQDELKRHFKNIIYIGSKNGIEKELIKTRTSYEFREITTVKFDRRKLFKNFSIPCKLRKGIKEAKKILKEVNPSVIFSKGGYVGLPVVIAGKKLGIPVIAHESDLTMGLANRIAKKYASKICTNFKITAEQNGNKCIHTGMPLKSSSLSKENAKQKLGIISAKPVLLITGGSLGAKAINEFIFKNIDSLTKKYFVYHIVGKNNLNSKIKNQSYIQTEFSNEMTTIYRASDYAISRAGANTIFELLSNKVLTIFVPLPKAASRGDQIENAKFMEDAGLSLTCQQEDLSIEKVQNLLNELEKCTLIYKNAINNANFIDGTENIMNIILNETKTPSK